MTDDCVTELRSAILVHKTTAESQRLEVGLGFKNAIKNQHIFLVNKCALVEHNTRYTLTLDQALCDWTKGAPLNVTFNEQLELLNGRSRLKKVLESTGYSKRWASLEEPKLCWKRDQLELGSSPSHLDNPV
jgi:hypothetical protein